MRRRLVRCQLHETCGPEPTWPLARIEEGLSRFLGFSSLVAEGEEVEENVGDPCMELLAVMLPNWMTPSPVLEMAAEALWPST